jgi:DNA-binding NarL/FixJ family response regulator
MKPLTVVVAQSNSQTAEMMAKSLYTHFRVVHLTANMNELRQAIPRNRADVVIVDLELATLHEVQQLKQEFVATTIVCTHRLADEKMWTEALAAGASDCCYSSDVRAIVLAASHTKTVSHAHAA